MNKFMAFLFTIIAFLIIIGFSGCGDQTKTIIMMVEQTENGLITVSDENGELWGFYNDDNFYEGDFVEITFNSRGEIIDAKLAD